VRFDEVSTAVTMKNAALWDDAAFLVRTDVSEVRIASIIRMAIS
jgi:hypothetical protein